MALGLDSALIPGAERSVDMVGLSLALLHLSLLPWMTESLRIARKRVEEKTVDFKSRHQHALRSLQRKFLILYLTPSVYAEGRGAFNEGAHRPSPPACWSSGRGHHRYFPCVQSVIATFSSELTAHSRRLSINTMFTTIWYRSANLCFDLSVPPAFWQCCQSRLQTPVGRMVCKMRDANPQKQYQA